ncbi:NACHT domain-containing protein [Streptomyces nojiriensis]|uniref:NACHT domain-containing protein n=1 Tax=Streptomyces nojiriensis TaxID=66374 RepID=UPI00167ADC84|nr:helix-turn-helix domain-containing protein [Streptomyces nojiriensis]
MNQNARPGREVGVEAVGGTGPAGAHRELIARIRSALAGRRQSEVARDAGIQPSTLSNVLNAKAVPTLTTLDLLARALDVTGPDLVELHRLRARADARTRRIGDYLTAARDAAREHPYAGVLPGIAPPLAAVYLNQRVHPWERASGAGSLPADDLLAGGRTCVVLAGPGGGKSSLLRTWLHRGTEPWLEGRGGVQVPVLVPAAALVDAPLADAVAAAVNRDLDGLVERLPPAFFATEPQRGAGWLVLVDGLDEVTDGAARRKVLRRLADTSRGTHTGLYRFIVATRPLPGPELDLLGADVPRYELQPFGRDDLPLVAASWFRCLEVPDPEDTTRRFLRALDRTRLAALAHVPLMTAMLCQLHAAAPEQPLPAGRGQVYRDFIELLHRHQRRAGSPHTLPLAAAEDALDRLPGLIAHLAAERLAGSTTPALDFLCSGLEALRPPRVPEHDWRAFLETAARRSGLLVPRGGDLVFLHQTLLEHLAARHLVRDPKEGARAIRRAFHRRRRHAPGIPLSPYATGTPPGIRPRVWFLFRYWQPPSDLSSTGFLLDAAHEAGLTLRRSPLRRLARRGGLPGWEFIASLAAMGTWLPDDVVATVAESLHAYGLRKAHTRSREEAAEALTRLGDPRGPDQLHALTARSDSSDSARLRAGAALVEHGDPRGPAALLAFSRDADASGHVRIAAAALTSRTGDPRGADVLRALALDPEIADHERVEAAAQSAGVGDPRAADLLHTLSADTTVGVLFRVKAADLLASSGDPRGAERLRVLGHSRNVAVSARSAAGEALVRLAEPEAAEVFHRLATERGELPNDVLHHAQSSRIEAARRLVTLGDPRGPGLLLAFSRAPEVGCFPRVRAAISLAAVDKPAAAEQLHALTRSVDLPDEARLDAAVHLAGLGDRRASPVLHRLALRPGTADHSRMQAARALVALGDPGAAGLLRALPPLFRPSVHSDLLLDVPRLLAELGDSHAAELLTKLAPDQRPGAYDRAEARRILTLLQEPRPGTG